LLLYNVSTVYAPQNDMGIRWDSAGISWGIDAPLVSDRDAAFPPLASFATPF
jgi:dTDP-4-dehydrorhamnose 3,5-epimerase